VTAGATSHALVIRLNLNAFYYVLTIFCQILFWTINVFSFPTCQVRVSRFYQSYFPPSSFPPSFHSGPFSGKVAAPFYGAYTTNSTSGRWQRRRTTVLALRHCWICRNTAYAGRGICMNKAVSFWAAFWPLHGFARPIPQVVLLWRQASSAKMIIYMYIYIDNLPTS